MTHRLTTDYAKKYYNRRLIVKVIPENVVTFFLDIVYTHAQNKAIYHWDLGFFRSHFPKPVNNTFLQQNQKNRCTFYTQ